MKQTICIYFSFFSFLFLLSSCNDSDDPTPFAAVSDAYIRSMNIDGTFQHAPVLLSSSNIFTPLEEAVASSSNGKEYILKEYWNNSLTFRYLPTLTDYSPTAPVDMSYDFVVVSSNSDTTRTTASTSMTNVLPEIKVHSFDYNADLAKFDIKWNNVGADVYLIKIAEKLDESPVYQSTTLVSGENKTDTVTYNFDNRTFKWYATPSSGSDYVVSVHAFNLESGNYSTLIHSESLATIPFVWGTSSSF